MARSAIKELGHPDFWPLRSGRNVRGGEPAPGAGAIPERGVVEVKGLNEETWLTAETTQVSQYWTHYGLVLVSNYRSFLLIGRDTQGHAVRLESFSLAANDVEFWNLRHASAEARDQLGEALQDYLRRALSYLAPLTRAADLAWFVWRPYAARTHSVASSKARACPRFRRCERAWSRHSGSASTTLRANTSSARTLIQTIFYGIFSAWVQWARTQPAQSTARFDWHAAGWTLHVPMVRTLFEQGRDA